MKKITAIILALLMLVSTLALFSCGKEEEKTTETAGGLDVVETEKKDDPFSVYDAEIKKLNGHEFKFVVREVAATHLTTNEVYAEALTGETINDAVYKRNSKLETTYDIKITEERNTDVTGTYQAALTAGEYIGDVMYEKIFRSTSLIQAGLLANLDDLENLNLQKTWWDQNSYKSLGIGGKSYFAVGDATTMDERSSWVLLFNKDRLEEVGLEVPYALVSDGKWTVDKMYEYMQRCKGDKDGDGAVTWGKDYFGYNAEREAPFAHVNACNAMLSSFTENGDIFLSDSVPEPFMKAWDKVKVILTDSSYYCTDSSNEFKKGLVAFYGINAGAMTTLTNATIQYGVMPFPKFDEAQENYCCNVMATSFSAMSIPVSAEGAPDAVANGFKNGIEQAAYLLEAFAYESKNTLTIAFYDQVLMRQTAQDPESRKMIELCLGNKIYDPTYLYRWGNIVQNIDNECGTPMGSVGTDVKWNTITSVYTSALPTARTAMETYIEYVQNAD